MFQIKRTNRNFVDPGEEKGKPFWNFFVCVCVCKINLTHLFFAFYSVSFSFSIILSSLFVVDFQTVFSVHSILASDVKTFHPSVLPLCLLSSHHSAPLFLSLLYLLFLFTHSLSLSLSVSLKMVVIEACGPCCA